MQVIVICDFELIGLRQSESQLRTYLQPLPFRSFERETRLLADSSVEVARRPEASCPLRIDTVYESMRLLCYEITRGICYYGVK